MTLADANEDREKLFEELFRAAIAEVFPLYFPALTPNKIIWHYTSLSGLLGILTSKTLWATNASYLNDTQEMVYGRQVCLNIFKSMELDDAELRGIAHPDMLQHFPSLATYIVCFCQVRNLLSQWSRYSENGHGVAIGFKMDVMAHNFPYGFLPIIYEKEKQLGFIAHLVSACLRFFKERNVLDMHLKFMEIYHVLHLFTAALKHPDFCEEQEIRLVVHQHPGGFGTNSVKIRHMNNMLIPYLALSPANKFGSAIHEVVVGPSKHRDLNRFSVKMLLTELGYPDSIVVTQSDTPFR